jgi:hypothetical protein
MIVANVHTYIYQKVQTQNYRYIFQKEPTKKHPRSNTVWLLLKELLNPSWIKQTINYNIDENYIDVIVSRIHSI